MNRKGNRFVVEVWNLVGLKTTHFKISLVSIELNSVERKIDRFVAKVWNLLLFEIILFD